MDYKGYHIEEEGPGKFVIYRSYEDWLNSKEPVDTAFSIDMAEKMIDSEKISGGQHILFPGWFKEQYFEKVSEEPIIHTGEEYGWPKLSTWYHVTQASNVPRILEEGLRVPKSREEVLFIGEKEVIPGIYLTEDRDYALVIAGIMYERKPGISLSLLRIQFPNNIRLVFDPEAMAAIVALDPVLPGLITLEVPLITKEMVEKGKQDFEGGLP